MSSPERSALTILRPLFVCEHPETMATPITVSRLHRVCLECGAWRVEVTGQAPVAFVRPRMLQTIVREIRDYDAAVAAAVAHVATCGAL